jgi:hypothetical protein
LTDRRGIRQAFDEIDPDIRREIRDTIGLLALEAIDEFNAALSTQTEAGEP